MLKEIPDVARTDILPLLAGIKRRRKEIGGEFPKVILLNANKDPLFQKDQIEKRLGLNEDAKEDPLDKYIDNWVMFIDKNMGHGKYKRPTPGVMPVVFNESRRNSVITKILN